MENRHGLVVDLMLTQATGMAEREAARDLLARRGRQRYSERRQAYDDGLRGRLPRSTSAAGSQPPRGSRIDRRTTRRRYAIASLRKRVEEVFGWMKTVGGGRKLRYIGVARNQLWATLAVTAYNLVRMVHIERAHSAA
jgi:IS5 family transposase